MDPIPLRVVQKGGGMVMMPSIISAPQGNSRGKEKKPVVLRSRVALEDEEEFEREPSNREQDSLDPNRIVFEPKGKQKSARVGMITDQGAALGSGATLVDPLITGLFSHCGPPKFEEKVEGLVAI